MDNWLPIVVLPNASIGKSIEMNDIALVPKSDERFRAACRRHPKLRKFLGRFTDAFRQKIDPAILIVREGTPEGYRETQAVAGFRDAVAISTLTTGRAILVSHESSMRWPIWAESLSIYPWMVDKFGEGLIARTPSILGSHIVEAFHGQSLSGFHLSELGEVDTPLFTKLAEAWIRRFSGAEVVWEDRALFRSLNVAYQACMMPGGQEATFYDVGRLLTNWVSATEILLHPGPNRRVGKLQVMDLIDGIEWCEQRLNAKVHPVRLNKTETIDRTLASSIYNRIDSLRSDFIHGNDVSADQLVTENNTQLLHVAASLYRMALATKLGVAKPEFTDDDAEFDSSVFVSQLGIYSDWKNPQERHERALIKALGLPEGDD